MADLTLDSAQLAALNTAVLKLMETSLLEGMALIRNEGYTLANRRKTLHHHRILDILYPGTAPYCKVVPIEALAPSLGEARASDNPVQQAEGYGPPSGVTLFVLDSPDKIVEVHSFLEELLGE